uniref:Retrovirus-related Pol polyprotein from transposon TNT 1-94 n=1 Tax=Tanacetum cinerariifolium TaxID=118510 RepID=A0A6L2KKJ0_TANCI|nr:retrovirus-related Pol polyprotein from transposon TNT 1-94 [Tanacetum cinerariifolium]
MMDWLSIVEIDKVIHIMETDTVKLVVEIESFGMSSNDFDKETVSFEELQLMQADLSCVHALRKLHLYEIHVVPNFQENSDDEADERSSEECLRDLELEFHERALFANSKHFIKRKNKGLVAEMFNWDEEEVSYDEEMTQIKTYLKFINIDLKFVEEQRLNLLSKYNKIVFELNKGRDDLLIFKQAKLDAVTFQIQDTKLTKSNHALQEQLKEERKDIWSRDQHIELVNIIGEPTKGMLTRSMAAKLTTASASECLFANFLSEIEPKKVFINKKDELGTIIKNKARLVAQGLVKKKELTMMKPLHQWQGWKPSGYFFAYATYMNFIFSDGCQKCLPEWKTKRISLYPIDSSEARPLKEFIIKFIAKNGQKPLTLNYKAFCESTGLDYDHPYTEVVKAEHSKIATNEALVQKTPVLKTSFLMIWRILLTFFVQKGKKKSQTMTQPTPKSYGPKASEALSQKRKNSKAQMTSLIQASIKSLSEKEVQNVVKEDPALNKKVLEDAKVYNKNSSNLTELLTMVKNFDFPTLKAIVESLMAVVTA